mmetsp:Transcript_110500/g.236130  ORF Transcript_110500/g.236130 Transcript_110500/m.236130 type:complete len:204 (-) Transcript_110500:144-755(-)
MPSSSPFRDTSWLGVAEAPLLGPPAAAWCSHITVSWSHVKSTSVNSSRLIHSELCRLPSDTAAPCQNRGHADIAAARCTSSTSTDTGTVGEPPSPPPSLSNSSKRRSTPSRRVSSSEVRPSLGAASTIRATSQKAFQKWRKWTFPPRGRNNARNTGGSRVPPLGVKSSAPRSCTTRARAHGAASKRWEATRGRSSGTRCSSST